MLCAIALGGLFFVLTWQSAIYALLAAVFSVVAFAGIAVLLSPIGMPALTAPFVLTTWLFLWPKAGFRALDAGRAGRRHHRREHPRRPPGTPELNTLRLSGGGGRVAP